MPKVKHLLRKLHIGSGDNDHHLSLGHSRPETNPNPNLNPSIASSSLSSSGSGSAPIGRVGAVELPNDRTAGDGCADFSFLEEEFQLQLALAISASDPARREDAESAQIDAAKKISLGCSVTDTGRLVDFLSLQYWSYDVVKYDEKVTDGFYDVYGITSNLVAQGKMPLLVDLEAMSVLDNMDYEVILVNRAADPQLQQLENRVYSIYMECQDSECGLIISGLIQKIANIVVDRMGGPVGDAEEMLKRWNTRCNELRNYLNTIILPLGWIDAGLSRHRALLFKVLADKVNLPCMLVKGSYYTGTDEGAVNLIKFDNGSEYIIDLMGAPGTLIPAESSNSHLPNYALDRKCFADVTEGPKNSCLVLDKGIETRAGLPDLDRVSNFGRSVSEEASIIASQTEKNEKKLAVKEQTERFEHDIGKLLPSLRKSCESSSSSYGEASHAQKMKVKNVSKYVISAAKNPEFAQKLHAVLLESGASPPPDLFLKPDPLELSRQEVPEQSDWVKWKKVDAGAQCFPDKFLSGHEQPLLPYPGVQSADSVGFDNKQKYSVEASAKKQELQKNVVNSNSSLSSDTTREGSALLCTGSNESIKFDATANPCQRQLENAIGSEKIESIFNSIDLAKNSAATLMESTNIGMHCACNGPSDRNNPVLSEVAEWEIPWEDLQIGKRIGIGSFGEVYHADWNDTEVAVKKFLSQDLSGDALIQFKCEVEIMLRLRHPNIVLFMGAVTRPPHLSILTEFLPRGSLYKLLHRPNSQLDEKRRLKMALDVAKGMNYLHTSHPTIVHRDLKSPNLLVDKNWVVKVSDFGLSRLKHHTFLSSKSIGGTPEWMAPEVLRNEPANEKCDIYSFGVILWELATLCVPWSGLNPMQVVGAVGFQNRHLEIPETVDPAVAQIISECWQTEPHLRPSFSQLMSRLRPLQHLVVEREPGIAQLYR